MMYAGVRFDGSCNSYESACKLLESRKVTATGRRRAEGVNGYPLGSNKGKAWVRELDDGAIALQLYGTDVVTWNTDNSVEIDNYGTKTTTEFAARYLPAGIRLGHTTSRGGDNRILFGMETSPGVRETHVCAGHGTVRFVHDGACWVPDTGTLADIILPTKTDRKRMRELSQEHNLKHFEAWMRVVPETVQDTDPIEHCGEDPHLCLEALREQRYRDAATLLPVVVRTNAFGNTTKAIPIVTRRYDHVISMGSVQRLKQFLWHDEGAIVDEARKVWSAKTYNKHTAAVRKLSAIGMHTALYGA
jgi:hypothetical protein